MDNGFNSKTHGICISTKYVLLLGSVKEAYIDLFGRTSKIYDNNIEKLEPQMIDTVVEN